MVADGTMAPELAGLIRSHPELARLLARELAYGQTRWAEIWLACVMAVFGAVLVGPGDTFSLPSFRPIATLFREDVVGMAALLTGIARLAALWYNGAMRRSPLVRVAGCAAGFLFYLAMTAGFVASAPPLTTGLVYGVLAIAELHSSSRAARDGSLLDSLGLRRRRRDRDQLAA